MHDGNVNVCEFKDHQRSLFIFRESDYKKTAQHKPNVIAGNKAVVRSPGPQWNGWTKQIIISVVKWLIKQPRSITVSFFQPKLPDGYSVEGKFPHFLGFHYSFTASLRLCNEKDGRLKRPHKSSKTQVYHSKNIGQVASFPGPVKHVSVGKVKNVTLVVEGIQNKHQHFLPETEGWDDRRIRATSSASWAAWPSPSSSSFFGKLLSLVFFSPSPPCSGLLSLRFPGCINCRREGGGARMADGENGFLLVSLKC